MPFSYSVIENTLKLSISSATPMFVPFSKSKSYQYDSQVPRVSGFSLLSNWLLIDLAAQEVFSESTGVIIHSLYLCFYTICERMSLTA